MRGSHGGRRGGSAATVLAPARQADGMLMDAPEAVFATGRDDVLPALLLRLDPDTITVWPGDDRVLSAAEFLRLWGWRIMSDTAVGGIFDQFGWGLVVDRDDSLRGVFRPGGPIWEGSVPLPRPWLDMARALPGRLVRCFAVPDSVYLDRSEILDDRVQMAAEGGRLLGARIPLRLPQAADERGRYVHSFK